MSAQARRIPATSLLLATAQVRAGLPAGNDIATALARASLAAAGPPGVRLLRLARSRWGRWLLDLAERCLLPGLSAHYAWRKHLIERWARQAVEAGARQLVVLGAGFDALGVRMRLRYPALSVYELDLPGTLHAKREALQALGIDAQRAPRLVDADLGAGGAGAVLRMSPGFDAAAPTVVVAEGVLMYLAPEAVARLGQEVLALLHGEVTVIGTAMDLSRGGRPGFRQQSRIVDAWLSRGGESFGWGVDRAALSRALGEAGLCDIAIADPDDAADPDPCPGEWLWRGSRPSVQPLAEAQDRRGHHRRGEHEQRQHLGP